MLHSANMINYGTDGIAKLDAEIAWLYKEVARIEDRCNSPTQDKNDPWHFMLDLQSKALREQAHALHTQRSNLLEVELRRQ